MRRIVYPNKFIDLKHKNEIAFGSSYYNFSDTELSRIGMNETPNARDSSRLDICVGNNDIQLMHKESKTSHQERGRSMKNRPLYSSVERMYEQTSATKSSRYNNLWKSDNNASTVKTMRPKPLTSTSRAFPDIYNHNKASTLLQNVGSAIKSPSGRLLSNTRPTIGREKELTQDWNTNLSAISPQQEKHVVKREKVQFRSSTNNATLTEFNSTFLRSAEDRWLYVIPEGSDITSEELSVVKINLTDYVRALLPKDHLIGNTAKLQRMGPYEKLQIVKPSKELQNQVFRAIMQKLEGVMPK